jgi:hypothetical protein
MAQPKEGQRPTTLEGVIPYRKVHVTNSRLIIERQSSYIYVGKEQDRVYRNSTNQGILAYTVTTHKARHQSRDPCPIQSSHKGLA